LTDTSVAEVHTRLLAPLLGAPGIGDAAREGITSDIRGLAVRGDVENLTDFGTFLDGVRERTEIVIAALRSPAVVFGDPASGTQPGSQAARGAGRGIAVQQSARVLRHVKRLQTDVRTNLILARRVAGEP